MTVALGAGEIEEILPHRDPFSTAWTKWSVLEPGSRVVARKLVREDEWLPRRPLPGRPIMPGVLIVEAMAQTGAVAVLADEANTRQARPLRRDRRRALQADRRCRETSSSSPASSNGCAARSGAARRRRRWTASSRHVRTLTLRRDGRLGRHCLANVSQKRRDRHHRRGRPTCPSG